jgi:dTDP-glucose 4,6-dehydratase
MRMLVTGAAGFIGSHYVRSLLTSGFSDITPGDQPITAVTVIDSLALTGDFDALSAVAGDPRLILRRGDIRDAGAVDAAMAGADAVVHFAAASHVDASIADPLGTVTVNVVGTQILLDAARRHRVGRFVQVSTDEVYGSVAAGAATPGWPLAPNSPYAATKAAADLLALAAHRTHGLDVVVTRAANTYGPWQFPEKVIPLFTARLLRGEPAPLYGDGSQVREWVQVDDHARAVHRALHHGAPGSVHHVAGTAALTNRALAARLAALCGADPDLVRPVTDRAGHDQRYALDDSATRRDLGWAPRVDFETGLADTVAWYRDHESWWSRYLRPPESPPTGTPPPTG